MEDEKFFSDESIVEQASVMINTKEGITNGIILYIDSGGQHTGVEICLLYEELKACLEYLEQDRWKGSVYDPR